MYCKILQVHLPKPHVRKVDTLQIASQQAQQVDHVAWAVGLLGWFTITPAVQQVKQAPLGSS